MALMVMLQVCSHQFMSKVCKDFLFESGLRLKLEDNTNLPNCSKHTILKIPLYIFK